MDKLILKLEGRIDGSNSGEWEEKLMAQLEADPAKEPMFDASDLTYISSAGLRTLMKIRKKTGQPITITNVSPDIYEIFDTTGFTSLFNVQKKFREISLDGCEVIGSGFFGTVYRIDDDTIVKMYDSPESIPMIENEKKMATMAFIKGIPTAISFDIVKCGERYGSVFEMLKSSSFNDMIIESPDKVDEIVETYTKFIKEVHQTEMDPGTLPFARDQILGYLETIKEMLPEDIHEKCRSLIASLPDDFHVVHGDIHMKNVMMSDNEPLLIDMDTLSVGQPIFDLQGLYVCYKCFTEDDPENSMKFLGIPTETCDRIWDGILHNYFKDISEDKLSEIEDKIKLVAYIRFMFILKVGYGAEGDLIKLMLKHAVEHLTELSAKINSLLLP